MKQHFVVGFIVFMFIGPPLYSAACLAVCGCEGGGGLLNQVNGIL